MYCNMYPDNQHAAGVIRHNLSQLNVLLRQSDAHSRAQSRLANTAASDSMHVTESRQSRLYATMHHPGCWLLGLQ